MEDNNESIAKDCGQIRNFLRWLFTLFIRIHGERMLPFTYLKNHLSTLLWLSARRTLREITVGRITLFVSYHIF